MDNAIPRWGFRAHGLIERSSMQLDSSHIAFRQPTGRTRWEAGRTSLIDFGAKEKAILSGDQVHGKEIGPDSWLYKAPDSSVWVVSAESSGGTVSVQLDRFGEFAVLPESYSYSVQRPSSNGNRYVRYDVAPNGSAAVFCVMSGPNVVSWDEITLSGMPESCEIVAKILFDDKQTQGTVTESNTLQSINHRARKELSGTWVGAPYVLTKADLGEDCLGSVSGTYTYTIRSYPAGDPPSGVHEYFLGGFENGSKIYKLEGAILSVYYTATGVAKEVRGGMVVETRMSGSVDKISGSGTEVRKGTGEFLGLDACGFTTLRTDIPLVTLKKQNTYTSVVITIGGSNYEAWAKKEEITLEEYGEPPVTTNSAEYSSGFFGDNVASSPVARAGSRGVSADIFGWRDIDGHAGSLSLSAATLANAVLAVQAVEEKRDGSASASYGPVFARGVDKGAIITKNGSADLPWVSYNPITGAVAFNHNTRVSWT